MNKYAGHTHTNTGMNVCSHTHARTHTEPILGPRFVLTQSGCLPQVSLPGVSSVSLPVRFKAGLLWGRDRCEFYSLCLLIRQQWIHLSHILLSPLFTQPPPMPPTPPSASRLSVFLLCPFVFTSDAGLSYRLSLSHTWLFSSLSYFSTVSHQPACPPQFPFPASHCRPPSAPGPSVTSQALSCKYTYRRWLELKKLH